MRQIENGIVIPNLLLKLFVVDVVWVSMIEYIILMDAIGNGNSDSDRWWWLIVRWTRTTDGAFATDAAARNYLFCRRMGRCGQLGGMICIFANFAAHFRGHNAIFAMFAETEHVTDATQKTRLFHTLMLAFVQRTLEWAVSIDEAAIVVDGICSILFQQPVFSWIWWNWRI